MKKRQGPESGDRSSIDDIIEFYMRDVDQTLICETFKLTPQQRLDNMIGLQKLIAEAHRAGEKLRSGKA